MLCTVVNFWVTCPYIHISRFKALPTLPCFNFLYGLSEINLKVTYEILAVFQTTQFILMIKSKLSTSITTVPSFS